MEQFVNIHVFHVLREFTDIVGGMCGKNVPYYEVEIACRHPYNYSSAKKVIAQDLMQSEIGVEAKLESIDSI